MTQDALDGDAVLVVDDDAAERIRLEAILKNMGCRVTCVGDGFEALSALESGLRPGIIVSDWSMPNLDGVELCQKIRGSASRSAAAYFILVTGKDDPSAVVDGLNSGADDFVAKPYRAEELRARVDAGRRAVNERVQLEEINTELQSKLAVRKKTQLRLQSGLDAAATLQRRQLPPRFSAFDGIECGHVARSAEVLAGDGFGCFPLCEGHIGFFLHDVAGHGVSAALNAFAVARTLTSSIATNRLLLRRGRPRAPSAVVRLLNEQFSASEQCDDYFTMVYGILDTGTGRGSLCQAGHPHPIAVRRDGEVTLLGEGGFPVGLLIDADYADTSFRLEPGERLTLFSDGVIEAGGEVNEMFGYVRLSHLLSSVAHMPLSHALDVIESGLQEWQGGPVFEDDVSLLVIARPAEEKSR